MTGADLTIIVPVWRRTHNLDRLVCSVIDTVRDAEVFFIVNVDDTAVHGEVEALRRDLFGSLVTAFLPVDWPGGSHGDYARKINYGYRHWCSTRPFLFTGADDIEFQPGWYEAARALMGPQLDQAWPGTEPMVPVGAPGVVGTVDDCNPRTMNGEHSTHSLVARWYADQGGTVDQDHVIYHEGYWHEYCDDELVRTAMYRDAYAHAFDAHVTHHHPLNGTAPDDPTYQRGRLATRRSRNHYHQRRKLWERVTR